MNSKLEVITPEGVAVDVKDAVGDVACPELIGLLVQRLVNKGVLDQDDLIAILPPSYQVIALQ